MATNTKGIYYRANTDPNATSEAQALAVADSVPVGPNFIINGAFDIWQRGASLPQAGGGVGCDMWREYTDSGSGTQSRDTTNFVSGLPQQSYRFTAGANSTNWTLWQIMESSHCAPLIGQTITFSIYLMSSTARTFRLSLGTNTTADAGWSAGGWVTSTFQDVSVTTGWARYSFTLTVPSTARTIQFSVSSNGANMAASSWINVAGAQVELGSVATPFRRNAPSIQAELAACQRYYIHSRDNFSTLTLFSSTDSWLGSSFISFPTQMRAAPSVSIWDTAGNAGQAHRQFTGSSGGINVATTVEYQSPKGFRLGTSVAGATDRAGMYYFQWVASAEL